MTSNVKFRNSILLEEHFQAVDIESFENSRSKNKKIMRKMGKV
jgi:hypothetical protein